MPPCVCITGYTARVCLPVCVTGVSSPGMPPCVYNGVYTARVCLPVCTTVGIQPGYASLCVYIEVSTRVYPEVYNSGVYPGIPEVCNRSVHTRHASLCVKVLYIPGMPPWVYLTLGERCIYQGVPHLRREVYTRVYHTLGRERDNEARLIPVLSQGVRVNVVSSRSPRVYFPFHCWLMFCCSLCRGAFCSGFPVHSPPVSRFTVGQVFSSLLSPPVSLLVSASHTPVPGRLIRHILVNVDNPAPTNVGEY